MLENSHEDFHAVYLYKHEIDDCFEIQFARRLITGKLRRRVGGRWNSRATF